MSFSKKNIIKEEDYRRLALDVLSKLNVIKVHERGDYYEEIGILSDEILNKALTLTKNKIDDLDLNTFKTILIKVYKEAGIEKADTHFNK